MNNIFSIDKSDLLSKTFVNLCQENINNPEIASVKRFKSGVEAS
jgi:hypothetical protein